MQPLIQKRERAMKILTDEELAQVLDKDIFRRISTAADKLGVDCYVVGGYVRDIFLERPSNDIDVVVVGSGISVASELKQMLGRKARLTVFRIFARTKTARLHHQCHGRVSQQRPFR